MDLKNIKEFYNEFYNNLKKDLTQPNPRHLRVQQGLKELLRQGMSVLELGCGLGITTNYIRSSGCRALGVDLSDRLVVEARRHFGGDFLCADLCTLRLKKKFDVVTLIDCLEHLPPERRPLAWETVKHHLNPDGILYLNLPAPVFQQWVAVNYPQAMQIIDESVPLEEVVASLGEHGFTLLKLITYGIDAPEQYVEIVARYGFSNTLKAKLWQKLAAAQPAEKKATVTPLPASPPQARKPAPPPPAASSPRRVGFFAGDEGNFLFVRELAAHIAKRGFAVRFFPEATHNLEQLKEALKWCETAWFEWANGPIIPASHLPKTCRIICRLHRYEAYSDLPRQVNWEQVDNLVFISPGVLATFKERLDPGIEKRTRVEVIPNILDPQRFPMNEKRVRGFNLSWVGRLQKDKNPALVVQIMARLRERDPRYRCYMIGQPQDPVMEQYLKAMIREMKLEDQVIYQGVSNDVVSWLEDKHFFLSTSVVEGHPVALMEAMLRGIKPIIHNFCGGARQLFPPELVFNTVEEAVDLILAESYEPASYRSFIEERYPFDELLERNIALVAGKAAAPRLLPQQPRKMFTPSVSIIIPTYNRAHYLGEAIHSALAQEYENLEILVVDDGSTDDTRAVVDGFASCKIRYIHKEHSGSAATRNRGISEAKGDFLMALGSDDVLLPDTINNYVSLLKEFPDADVLYGDILVTDNNLRELNKIQYEDWLGRNKDLVAKLLMGNAIPDGGSMVRRECYERIGLFDESFRRAHDYEWWTRLAPVANFKYARVPVYKWRWHNGNMSSGTVNIDLSFDARIIHLMLERYSLQDLFPQINFSQLPRQISEGLAYLHLGQRLFQLNDIPGALKYFSMSHELYPSEETLDLIQELRQLQPAAAGGDKPAEAAAALPAREAEQPKKKDQASEPARRQPLESAADRGAAPPERSPLPPAAAPVTGDRKMRLMLAVHGFPPEKWAGTEIYTYNLAQELRGRGHEIRVLYPEKTDALPEGTVTEDVYQDLPISRISIKAETNFSKYFKNEALAEAFGRYLDTQQVDLIHFQHLLLLSASMLQSCSQRHIPALFTAHDEFLICSQCHLLRKSGQLCPGPKTVDGCVQCFLEYHNLPDEHLPDLFYITAQRRQYLLKTRQWMNALIVPSRFLQEKIADAGFQHPRTLVAPLGLPPFTPMPWQPDPEVTRFVFLGNIIAVKGLDILIKAFNLVAGDRARLDIYGRIDDQVHFQHAMAQADPQRRIEYHGPYTVADLPQILSQSDMAIVPSRSESYSLVTRECLHAGVPVLASDVAALPEIIQDGENGILFKPNDHRDLAEKINLLLAHPERLLALRRQIQPVRTIAEDAAHLEQIYLDTLKDAGTKPLTFAAPERRLKIGFLTLEPHAYACPYLRLKAPLNHLDQAGEISLIHLGEMVNGQCYYSWDDVKQLDAVIIQRQVAVRLPLAQLKKELAGYRTKIVFEIDDAMTHLPPDHVDHFYTESKTCLEEYLAGADLVTVATPQLQRLYEHFNKNIAVLPNVLDLQVWPSTLERTWNRPGPVKILISGTLSHNRDLHMIEEAVAAILEEFGAGVKFLFWGVTPGKFSGHPQVEEVHAFTTNYLEYARLLQELEVDLALVPLEDNASNQAKSPIKWLEYSICQIPGIFSDLETYRPYVEHLETGVLVRNNARDWYEAMKTLISDPALRQKIARQAQKTVLRRHTLEKNAGRWLTAYRRLCGLAEAAAPDRRPQVSIIIPVFNKLQLTRDCLASIYEHAATFDDFEVIVVDNGSTDGTGDFLRQEEAAGYVRVVANPGNLGFARACNQGAEAAAGDFLLFLNNDTVVTPGWLAALHRTARKDDRIAAVGAKLMYPDDRIQHAGVVFNKQKKIYHIYRLLSRHHPAVNKERQFQVVTAACMLLRKQVFEEVDRFDEGFRNGFEDVDLCLKMGQAGYKIVYTPESEVYHLESQTPGRNDSLAANSELLSRKWSHIITSDDHIYYAQDGITVTKVSGDEKGSTIIMEDENENIFWEEARKLKEQGGLKEAEEKYFNALRFNPYDVRNGPIAMELGELYEMQQQYADAERLYREVVTLAPSAANYASLGRVQKMMGHFEEAIVSLEKAKNLWQESRASQAA